MSGLPHPGRAPRRPPPLWLALSVVAAAGAVFALAGLFDGGAGTVWADPLTRFLLAVTVILTVSHLFGEVLRRLGQPSVVGEILGGLLLGPSALGLLWPRASERLFTPSVLDTLDQVSQLGLVIFMFLVGSEVRTGRLGSAGRVGTVLFGSMAVPFVLGTGFALAFGPTLIGPRATTADYALFVGLALAITAVPVLARVLVDLGLDRTRVGSLAMTCAALGDGLAWLVLTVLLTGADPGGGHLLTSAVSVVALVALTFFGVRPLLLALLTRAPSPRLCTVVLVTGAIGFAVLTQAMHLHPVIGAFLFGTAVPREVPSAGTATPRGVPLVERATEQLRGVTMLVLLPLFFASVGLKTSLGAFGADTGVWLVFAAMLVVAQVTKVVGAGGAARLAGLSGRESLRIGVLMNCRGVTELIVATIGHQAGLINDVCFTMLVLVAVATTALTGVLAGRLTAGEESGSPAPPPVGADPRPADQN
ncbi:cation:proton antiporter [Streptomyces salinarius]|uniref:cation:proton antiporter n=1 Tax=Streptomyces salinarius TaxID=2762598 RepID=UPI00164741CD|nr:cation:proton antiporter [Streptomyces salinarius]